MWLALALSTLAQKSPTLEARFVDGEGRPIVGVEARIVRGQQDSHSDGHLHVGPSRTWPVSEPSVARTGEDGVARIEGAAFSVRAQGPDGTLELPHARRVVYSDLDGRFRIPSFPGVESFDVRAFAPRHYRFEGSATVRPGELHELVAERIAER